MELSKQQIKERLDLVSKYGHGDRFGKFSNSEHSCIYIWKAGKYIIEYETINNGVRTGLYTATRAKFLEYMLKTNARVHWTVRA